MIQALAGAASSPATGATGGTGGGGSSGSEVLLVDGDFTRTNANAGWRLSSSGVAQALDDVTGNFRTLYTWLVSGTASLYQVRATLTGGYSPQTGSTAVWMPLTSTAEWRASDSVLLIEVRRAADSVVVASATIQLTLDYGPA